jgi:protein-disulfide isomerase
MKADPGIPIQPSRARPNLLRKRLSIIVPALVLLGVGVLIIKPYLNFNKPAAASANPAPMDAAPALGPKSAPVTILEYADFGCPSCWVWYKQGVLNQLRSKYGDQIRFVWRDYPVITSLSPRAAEAGQCANEQGKFWQFHDAIYANNGAIEASNLEAYAAAVGLDLGKFDQCVSSRRYKDRVIAEETEAFTHGYNGAPFFLINDKPLIGPQSLDIFSGLIDPLLAAGK